MPNIEKYDDLVIGSGIAGKFAAWTRDTRRRMAIVERGALGGACPNVACLPSKNIIWSARVISLARRGIEFGLKTDSLSVDIAAIQAASARWSGSCARHTRSTPKPAARN
jgi:pyruvate/2-oxoglutarate dehydrogenase complex dihydrolipoamide dehydrogenase (E3) component